MENITNLKNLRLLWWLRSIAIVGQTTAVLVVTLGLQIPLHTFPLWSIIFGMALINGFTLWRIKTAKYITEMEFFGQLLTDITALFGLLYFTGGATNPFASLFILQVIIAAITLTPFYTWIAAGITIAFYTILMVWSVEVPYFMHHHIGDFFNLHVQGMWISFIMLAVIIAWFVVRMNTTIRRQDSLLAEAEKLAAIGTLAASAAHELGTPLATLFVLAEDADNPMFKEQLMRCKQILSRITAAGGVTRAEGGAPMPLDTFLKGIVDHWEIDHPDTALAVDIQQGGAPRIVGEYGLEQAIRNLLDNAADASPEAISVSAKWTSQTLTIAIADKGTGVPQEIADTFGEVGVTTKQDGLGLGLFLARSVITRLEGTLDVRHAPTGGTIATITLPLRRLAV